MPKTLQRQEGRPPSSLGHRRRRRCLPPPRPAAPAELRPPTPAQQDLDPKMRGRLEVKLEELRAAASEQARKELERKYAVRYHKVGMRQPAGWRPAVCWLVVTVIAASW